MVASGSFPSVLLLLWLLLPRTLSAASLLEYVPQLDRSDAALSQLQAEGVAAL